METILGIALLTFVASIQIDGFDGVEKKVGPFVLNIPQMKSSWLRLIFPFLGVLGAYYFNMPTPSSW